MAAAGSCNQQINAILPSPRVEPRFIFYWAKQLRPWLEQNASATTISIVNKGRFEKAPLPLPPIGEQRRIVAKLGSLLGRSKCAHDKLCHISRMIERYKQAILATAFRGDLTAVWRANRKSGASVQEPSSSWKKHTLIDLCNPHRGITYGVIKLGEEVSDGTPCLRTSNVRWLRIDTDGVKRISPVLSSDYARTILKGGEVLVNVRGTLGGVAVATSDMAGWNVSREVAVVPVDTARFDFAYVAYWIGANASQRWLTRMEKGVAYTGVNLEDLRKLPIEVPSIEEQQEIVRRVADAFSRTDIFDGEVSRAIDLLDHLDRAVLARAFAGDLISSGGTAASEATLSAAE